MLNESTATAIDIDSAFLGQLEEVAPQSDPRMVRWGFNPGLRNIMIAPLATGLKESLIPIGKFIPHTTFKTPKENCTLDEYKEKEYFVDVTAEEVAQTFARSLAKDPTSGRDWGYVTFGYGEANAVKMAAMNQILIPTLQQIRSMFGELAPIDAVCRAEDELDLGEPRTHCASCHLEWIKSDACAVSIADAIATGRTMLVNSPEGPKEVFVRFDREQLEEYREMVQSSLERYKKQAHRDWSTLLQELENKKRDQIQEAEHFLRKDLHQPRPANREQDSIERIITATQAANAGRDQQQNYAPAADNSEVINRLAESQAMMAASIAQTNALLAQMAANQQSATSTPAPAEPAAIEAPAGAPDATKPATSKTKTRS